MGDDITKGIVDKADGVLVEVYKDAVSPIIKPIGEILGFLPRSLKLALSGWEKWLINGEETIRLTAEAVREKLQTIPAEKLSEPEPYVAIPAMQQLSYCVNNDELRDLYANLLVSSMNTDKKWQVHPAFVDIIKQLTPDEAKFIKALTPNVSVNNPLIDVRIVKKETRGGSTIIYNFTNVGIDKIDLPKNICSYVDNLERLKLIVIPPTMSLVNKELYKPLISHPLLINSLPKTLNEGSEIRYEYKVFCLTNFGADFINVCCK